MLRLHRLGGRPIGRTPDSDSGYPGSSPGLPANLFNELIRSLNFVIQDDAVNLAAVHLDFGGDSLMETVELAILWATQRGTCREVEVMRKRRTKNLLATVTCV